jgi:SLAP domain-containing protein
MSWLLENWFGSKESLEQVREEIQENLQKEIYLGVSGIENPEQSSTRVPSQELYVSMNGPWQNKLDDTEAELLQYIHEQLPAVVRDEVGIIPFFAQPTAKGYLVLAYIRNATKRSILLQKLSLSLATPDGEVVCRKSFNMFSLGPIDDMVSRPCEFLFRWDEFEKIPEKEVPLTLVYTKSSSPKRAVPKVETGGLNKEEWEQYNKRVSELGPLVEGQVELRVLDVIAGEDDGLKVVVLFRNGLDKRLEFTRLPIEVRDQSGDLMAKVQYTLENLKVEGKSHKVWAFEIPASSIRKPISDLSQISAVIPRPKQQKKPVPRVAKAENKGLLQ